MKYSYQIYSPSGNDTALVLPLEQDAQKRRPVARQIMKLHPKVEQVGFLSSKKPQLLMAGGEFCGNALRAAASFYLADRAGELKMEVSGTGGHALKAGRTLSGEVYAQMLGPHRIHELVEAREDFFLVRLPGIVQVIMPCHKKQVQGLSPSNIKEQAVRILQVLDLMQEPAAGVISGTVNKSTDTFFTSKTEIVDTVLDAFVNEHGDTEHHLPVDPDDEKIIVTINRGLQKDDKVIMLRVCGGQKFVILSRVFKRDDESE